MCCLLFVMFYASHHTINKSSLSPHPIPQSTYRHILFSSQPIATPYSPVNLSPHPIPQSTYRHTLFPKPPVAIAYLPVVPNDNEQTNINRDRCDVTSKRSVQFHIAAWCTVSSLRLPLTHPCIILSSPIRHSVCINSLALTAAAVIDSCCQ